MKKMKMSLVNASKLSKKDQRNIMAGNMDEVEKCDSTIVSSCCGGKSAYR